MKSESSNFRLVGFLPVRMDLLNVTKLEGATDG